MTIPSSHHSWKPLTEASVKRVPPTTGVFQVRGPDGTILDIDYAGARSLFGLREALTRSLETAPEGSYFRIEVLTPYLSRFEELLLLHEATVGPLPEAVRARGVRARGRISPIGSHSPSPSK